MTARVGPRLSAALADLGVPHPGDPHPVARDEPVFGGPEDRTAIVRVVVRLGSAAEATLNDELVRAGLFQATGSGTIRTGAVSLDTVPTLAAHPAVASVELRETFERDIHTSVPATHADVVRTGSFGLTGAGVIVGIIDSGIDVFHHAFRHDDGSTRILALHDYTSPHSLIATGVPTGGDVTLGWFPPKGKPGAGTLQTVTVPFNATAAQIRTAWETIAAIQAGDIEVTGGPLPGTPVTMRFTGRYRNKDVDSIDVTASTITPAGTSLTVAHGLRYSEADIQAALDADNKDYGSWDAEGHGTHCAGIAAGDGSQAGNCHLADYYVGVAPEADLVIAKADSDDTMIEALDFIFAEATAQSMPVVINISQGGRSGARDGSTELELKIDELLELNPEGRVIIKSAGNNGRLHDYDAVPQVFTPGSSLHGRGTATTATALDLTALVIATDRSADSFDFWYSGAGRLGITVKAPRDAATTPEVLPGAAAAGHDLHGHSIRVTSEVNASVTNRHRITVRIVPPTGGQIRQGEWVFTLRLVSGPDTDVDCWIQLEKSDAHARFVEADHEQARTLTPPGTAHRIITVANYDHRDNEIADSSSRGPTTDTRTGLETKPDIAAPGTGITAAKSGAKNDGICCDCCTDFYTTKSGTSMAAPHITGIVALMLEFDDDLTWEDVRNHLRASADPPDPITEPTLPDATWGAGVANAEAAIQDIEDSVFAEGAPSARQAVRGPTTTTTQKRTRWAPAVVPALAAQVRAGAPGAATFDELRAAVLGTPTGQLLFALVSTHLTEALRLVNTERRVTVAWHRMGGPALIDAVLMPPGDAPVRVPESIAGTPLRPGLERFLDAIAEAGSLPLRQDVAQHRELLLALPGTDLAGLERLGAAG